MARVLLIVGGGIAAYKSLELVRLLKKADHEVTPVLTKGGEHFVTAMSLGTLAESQVHSSLWELKDEVEIGHIQLSRAADLLLVCPATADLLVGGGRIGNRQRLIQLRGRHARGAVREPGQHFCRRFCRPHEFPPWPRGNTGRLPQRSPRGSSPLGFCPRWVPRW